MDLMEIRRRLFVQIMGGGDVSNFIKGTISVETAGVISIDFGKTMNDYIVFIEMTDSSYTKLVDAIPNLSGYKAYAFLGKRNFKNQNAVKTLAQRLMSNTSTGVVSTNAAASYAISFADSNISLNGGDIENNTPGNVYVGYSYNYTIIPFD